jgi:hypothetical protein
VGFFAAGRRSQDVHKGFPIAFECFQVNWSITPWMQLFRPGELDGDQADIGEFLNRATALAKEHSPALIVDDQETWRLKWLQYFSNLGPNFQSATDSTWIRAASETRKAEITSPTKSLYPWV